MWDLLIDSGYKVVFINDYRKDYKGCSSREYNEIYVNENISKSEQKKFILSELEHIVGLEKQSNSTSGGLCGSETVVENSEQNINGQKQFFNKDKSNGSTTPTRRIDDERHT